MEETRKNIKQVLDNKILSFKEGNSTAEEADIILKLLNAYYLASQCIEKNNQENLKETKI